MEKNRDEVLVIPEAELGGFMCPKCLGIAIGKKWASHAKYCPDCGQHIKISTSLFLSLKNKAANFTPEQQQNFCEYYMKDIAGIYKDIMHKMEKAEEQIEGQMSLEDIMKG